MRKFLLLSLLISLTQINAQSLQWANGLNSPGANANFGTGITHDKLGNSIVTGFSSTIISFKTSTGFDTLFPKGYQDFYVAKIDANGNCLWVFDIGAVNDTTNSMSCCIDANGNIFVTGYFTGTIDFNPGIGINNLTAKSNNGDIFVAKYDANGNYLWAFNMGGNGNLGSQGYNSNQGGSITADANGNIFVTGFFQGTADFNPSTSVDTLKTKGNSDVWLAKYDANGNYQWAFNIGSIGQDNNGQCVSVDTKGNVFITGYFSGTADFDQSVGTHTLTAYGKSDIFLAKYNTNGNYLWAFNAGCLGGTKYAQGIGVSVDTTGGVFMTGGFSGTTDFNPGAGTNNLNPIGTYQNIFLAKYDSSGNYLWAFKIGSTTHNNFGLSVSNDGNNVLLSGDFGGTGDFDPSTNTHNITSAGIRDLFLAKYDANSNYIWAFTVGSISSYSEAYSVSADINGNVWLTGYYQGTNNDFDPNAGTDYLNCTGLQDIFIAKYSTSPTGIKQFENKNTDVEVYPNPSNGNISISSTENIKELRVYDILGNIISTTYPEKKDVKITIENEGVYFIHLNSSQEASFKKVIVTK
jgi:hypothetical protein